MDTAYVKENPSTKWPYKVLSYLHFRYLKLLVIFWHRGKPPKSFPHPLAKETRKELIHQKWIIGS